jgi:long-chain acyl-CoA synthetase
VQAADQKNTDDASERFDVLFGLLRFIMRRWFRLTVEGIDRLPETGPFILTPNHTSFLDPVALIAALPWRRVKSTYWAGWTGILFRGRISRFFSRMARVFPVDPDRSPGLSLAYGTATLKRQNALVWFPEGWRSPTGELCPFMLGIGLLVNRTKAPAVPVLIEGGYQALPFDRWLPRRAKITVVFGSPLSVEALEAAGERDDRATRIANALHDAVADLRTSSKLQMEPPAVTDR